MPTLKIMRGRASLLKPFLATLATLLAVVAIVYGSLWMYAVRRSRPAVELGFNNHHNPQYDERTHSQSVGDVVEGGPAERVEVQDNGKGISPQKRLEMELAGKAGVGIRGMRERLRQLGGTLEIGSQLNGRGTIIVARLPIDGTF
jgi:hypothetical protein